MSDGAIRPDARAFLDALNATPLTHMETLDVDSVRAMLKQARLASGVPPRDIAVRQDLTCRIGELEFALRLYDAQQHRRGASPVVVYYHGGGFVLGDLDTHDALCATIAEEMGLPVVAVDYRLAPEHPWPAAPDDAEGAARWVVKHLKSATDRQASALVLADDSAGANLAAVTARALRDRPAAVPVVAQYLIYPCTAAQRQTASRHDFAEGLFLTAGSIDWFFDHYAAPDGDARIDLLAAPLAGMPPTLIVTAGLDPLRDEGRDYAARLIHSGVPVVYQEAVGNIHGCFSMVAAVPSTAPDVSRSLDALKFLIAGHPAT